MTATGGELVVGFRELADVAIRRAGRLFEPVDSEFQLDSAVAAAGGRARVMERLTISERSLLANVRQMEHYQRGFYLNVVTGRDAGQGPSRRGGLLGGSGLEGFSGVGVGGFGRVGGVGGNQQNTSVGFTGGAGAQQAGGYIGLLQTAQVIRNQYSNIAGSATAWSNCRRPTKRVASIGSRSIWRGRRSTTRKASCSTTRTVRRRARQFQSAVWLAAVARSEDRGSAAGSFQSARSRSFDVADSVDGFADGLARGFAGGDAGGRARWSRRRVEGSRAAKAFTDARNWARWWRGCEIVGGVASAVCAAQLDLARLQTALPTRREFLRSCRFVRKRRKRISIRSS